MEDSVTYEARLSCLEHERVSSHSGYGLGPCNDIDEASYMLVRDLITSRLRNIHYIDLQDSRWQTDKLARCQQLVGTPLRLICRSPSL